MHLPLRQIPPERVKRSLTLAEFSQRLALKNKNDIVELKHSGTRRLLHIRPFARSAVNYLTSRRISKETGRFKERQDDIPRYRDYAFPSFMHDSVLDGEHCSEVAGGMHGDAVHALSLGEGVFWVWDLLVHRGSDLRASHTLQQRRDLLHSLEKHFPKWLRLVKPLSITPQVMADIASGKIEGAVVKELGAFYDGRTWYKVKRSDTSDVIFVGVTYSKAASYVKHGWIRGVTIGQWCAYDESRADWDWLPDFGKRTIMGKEHRMLAVGQCSGFNEAVRANITRNWQKYMGEVFAIKCEVRLPSGKFQNPRYEAPDNGKVVRDDKDASECVYEPEQSSL